MKWHCEPPPGSQFPVLEVDARSHASAVFELGRQLDQQRPDLGTFAECSYKVVRAVWPSDGWLKIGGTHYRHQSGRLLFGSRAPERWRLCASDGSPTGESYTSLADARAATTREGSAP